MIQPHAGYAYSGPTAAYGAKAVMGGRYSRVIILGPAHRVYMENRICIPSEADGMSTPLGTLAFDREALEKLRSLPFIATGDKILAQEHSVQIQLPFLQYALGNDFKLVPVVVGQLDDAHVKSRGRPEKDHGQLDAGRRQFRFHALRQELRLCPFPHRHRSKSEKTGSRGIR